LGVGVGEGFGLGVGEGEGVTVGKGTGVIVGLVEGDGLGEGEGVTPFLPNQNAPTPTNPNTNAPTPIHKYIFGNFCPSIGQILIGVPSKVNPKSHHLKNIS